MVAAVLGPGAVSGQIVSVVLEWAPVSARNASVAVGWAQGGALNCFGGAEPGARGGAQRLRLCWAERRG